LTFVDILETEKVPKLFSSKILKIYRNKFCVIILVVKTIMLTWEEF